jgi:hypothetical protein
MKAGALFAALVAVVSCQPLTSSAAPSLRTFGRGSWQDNVIARYLLDEWDFPGPHWVNHTIPVFEMPADAN